MTDKEKESFSEEEKAKMAEEWEAYVRSEVNALLDVFLPDTIAGNVGIKYAHPIIEKYEDGTKKINENEAVGVRISINFKFAHQIEVPNEDK